MPTFHHFSFILSLDAYDGSVLVCHSSYNRHIMTFNSERKKSYEFAHIGSSYCNGGAVGQEWRLWLTSLYSGVSGFREPHVWTYV